MTKIRIHSTGPITSPSNTIMYWHHSLGRVDVNQTCGALFGFVFDQYAVVSLSHDEGEYRLTRDTNLLSVLQTVDCDYANITIWAKHHLYSD